MGATRKPRVRTAEDDLMNLTSPRSRSEARCVPLGSGAMGLSVCKGEQHPAEGYEHVLDEEGALESVNGKECAEKTEEKTTGDE